MKANTVAQKVSNCLYKLGIKSFVFAVRTDDKVDGLAIAVSGDCGLWAITARHLDRAVDEEVNDVFTRRGDQKA